MKHGMRRVLMAVTGAVAVAAATALVVIRVGRPLYYSDGERAHLGASAALREAPMLLWSRPEPEVELPGKLRGRAQELPDGSFVYGVARDDQRTELVRYQPRRAGATAEPIAALTSQGHDLAPSLAPDGRTLYFASDRPHAEGGGYDIWCANLHDGEIFAPRPLSAPINTLADESDPLLDPLSGELVFARRAADRDGRGAFSLWICALDAAEEAADAVRALLPPQSEAEVVFDREPTLSADGRTLFFMRQRGFDKPMLMRAWRHSGAFVTPVQVDVAAHDAKLRAPALLADGRALRLLDVERGLLYRAQATEVYPWWEGQAWLEHLLLVTLILALLIWLLLALGKRWRALDIVTWCLIASLLLHVLILAWLRGVEIVRHYSNPAPRLGEIEVSLVASGGSVDINGSSPGPELAHELRFSGHEQQVTAELPTSAVDAQPAQARAIEADPALQPPEATAHAVEAPSLTDAAAAAALLAARSAERALAAAPSAAVQATPLAAAEAARQAAPRSDRAFEVSVPAAEARPQEQAASSTALAVPGARQPTPAEAAAAPQPQAAHVADAAQLPAAERGASAAPAAATSALAAPGLSAVAVGADAERRALAQPANATVLAPDSTLTPVEPAPAPPARGAAAGPSLAVVPSDSVARPTMQPLHEGADVPAVASGSAVRSAVEPTAAEQLPAPRAASSAVVRAPAAASAPTAVVVAPTSVLASTPSAAPSVASIAVAPLPREQAIARPMKALDDRPAQALAATRVQAPSSGTMATRALAEDLMQPGAAPVTALRAAAPLGGDAAATVVGPRDVLAAPMATAAATPRRQASGPSPTPELAAPSVHLREVSDAVAAEGASSVAMTVQSVPQQLATTALAGPAPAIAAPSARASAAHGDGLRDSVLPTPAQTSALSAPLIAAAAARREAPVLTGPSGPSPKVALRDDRAAVAPTASPAAPQPARASQAIATTSLVALPTSLVAALVASPHRTLRDQGLAEVARGILPPGSLLPLLPSLRASASDTQHVAALPELYRSRFGPQKVIALEAFGGSEETEAAVRKGLEYLASIQRDDGAWGKRRRPHEKYGEVWVGKSALCVLAFLGAGHTQDSDTPHAATVRKALAWLLAQQDPDSGHFGETSSYSHGITTYALAECYAITKDAALRAPVEQAVAWMLRNQNRGRDRRNHGGWGYYSPTLRPEDRYARTSITAWMVMALKSAQMSGLDVPPPALADAEAFLWRMFDAERGNFLYSREPSRLESEWRTLPGSTPASVFCLLLLGADRDDERVRAASAWILERAPTAFRRHSLDEFVLRARGNVYFWYYGSLACFLAGGDVWEAWNTALKRVLLEGQSDDGSFAPIDEYADYAGDTDRDRAYTTAMCVLSLEVYYRYFTPLVKPK